jgi:Conserved region in glutamate synthase
MQVSRATGTPPSAHFEEISCVNYGEEALCRHLVIGINVRERIRLGASGKIVSAFDIARAMALGADWCNAARGFMFALGCIQSQTPVARRVLPGLPPRDGAPGMVRQAERQRLDAHAVVRIVRSAHLDRRLPLPQGSLACVGEVLLADSFPYIVLDELEGRPLNSSRHPLHAARGCCRPVQQCLRTRRRRPRAAISQERASR